MRIQRNFEIIGLAVVFALSFSSQALAEGSRYDLPRDYHSEISPAKAYLEMKAGESVLIDVRRLREHRAGHPYAEGATQVHAYNAPFPHKVSRNDQTPQDLYSEVYDIIFNRVGGDENTPITTLCRTGFRSVLAGNILASPSDYGITGPAFTNVRNIWEGFIGRYKEPYVAPLGYDGAVGDEDAVGHIPRNEGIGNKGVPHSLMADIDTLLEHEALDHKYLDLNNNDILDNDSADVCDDTNDKNEDKDGWRNYQELPTSTEVLTQYAYGQDTSQYPTCTPPTP